MQRSFRYVAFAGSGILSGVIAWKLSSVCQKESNIIHAAAANTTGRPEVLRSNLAGNFIQEWDNNWDFREPRYTSSPKKSSGDRVPSLAERFGGEKTMVVDSKPTATRNLVFIRHGQYVHAEQQQDRILTQLGRQQAEVTGKRLQRLHLEKQAIDKLVISSMIRAKETGDIIQGFLPNVQYQYCDLLQEGAPCQPEPPSSTWKPDFYEIFQDSARIEAAFRKYFHRADPEQKNDSLEVYVCHANVIRYFICRALQFPPEGWLRMSIENCGITWFTISPTGKVSLRSMGDVGHLAPNMLTTRAEKSQQSKS